VSSATPILDLFRRRKWEQKTREAAVPAYGGAVEQAAPAGIRIALFLFIVAFPLSGFMVIDLGIIGIPFGVTLNYIAGPLLVLLWLTRNRRLYPALPNPLTPVILLYITMAFLSVFLSASIPPNAADFADKKPYVFSFTQSLYLCFDLVTALTLTQVFSAFPSLQMPALRLHIYTVCFVCVWGVYQWLAYFFGWEYVTFFNNNPYRSELYDQNSMGLKRVSSVLHEPSDLGLYLLTAIPLLILPLCERHEIVRGRARILVLALCLITLFMSTSFSGYLAFVFFVWLLFVSKQFWRNKRLVLKTGVIVFIGFAVAATFFSFSGGQYSLQEAMVERAASSSDHPDDSTFGRVTAAVAAMEMFVDHPLVGVGEGNSGFHYDEYTSVWVADALPRVDALLPKILAEHGLIGGGLFLLLLYRVFRPRGNGQPDPSDFRFVLKLAVMTCFFDLFTSCYDMERFHVWLITAIFFAVNNNWSLQLDRQTHRA
jgi:hypothetical protein